MLSAATHTSHVRTGSPFSTLAKERRAWRCESEGGPEGKTTERDQMRAQTK
jgi:hypothetical protein